MTENLMDSPKPSKSWTLSIEFFPPKTDELCEQFEATAREAKGINLDFVSITYGAGGKSRQFTRQYADWLKEDQGFKVMPHLTCVGQDRDEIEEIIARYARSGYQSIMALRGDTPKGEDTFPVTKNGFRYATELVQLTREKFPDLEIGVAGYPETHPEAPDEETDLKHLKTKVDAGADVIVTQLFFKNEDFFRFRDNCRKMGISVPIHAGLLTPVNLKLLDKFCGFCGAHIPDDLRAKLEPVQGDNEAATRVGAEWTGNQLRELLKEGVDGIHFYPLNKPQTLRGLKETLADVPGFLSADNDGVSSEALSRA